MGLTYLGFQAVPVGFIPNQDKGYLVINAQLPDGSSLDRTDKIIEQMSAIARDKEKVPGVWHTIDLPGYSAVLGTNISNVGGMFVILDPFDKRKGDPEHKSADAIAKELRKQYAGIRGARISVFGAPAIDGLGTTGGFKVQVQDLGGAGLRALQGSVQNLADQGNADPRLVGLFRRRPRQQFHRQPAAALRADRPRQAEGPKGLAGRREPNASSLSRRHVRQRRDAL